MNASYIWFIIFFCIAYLVITDQSVAKAFYLITYLIRYQYEKFKWWIFHSPTNPIVKYLIWRRSMKLAKELMDEFKNK